MPIPCHAVSFWITAITLSVGPSEPAQSPSKQQKPSASAKQKRKTPPARSGHDLVFDPVRKTLLLVNGDQKKGRKEIWGWDGKTWKVVDRRAPLIRTLGGVAFDSQRGVLVLYGGSEMDPLKYPSPVNEYDGSKWRTLNVDGPGPRDHMAMVFDDNLGKCVVFGGQREDAKTFLGDTWLWDGKEWEQVDGPGPEPRVHHDMAYDAARKKVVLFGGFGPRGSRPLLDTWEFDGSAWKRYREPGPSARSGARMAYHSETKKVVLFGGGDDTQDRAMLDDTWLWDGQRWELADVKKNPPARCVHALGEDPLRKKVVLFGGSDKTNFNDTWEWNGTAWRQVNSSPAK